MNIGDHLFTTRFCYTHHGLYVGNNQVIHYTSFTHGLSGGEIKRTSLENFKQGQKINIQNHPDRKYSRKISVSRAYSRLGERKYNIVLNNCEHFVNWCISGKHSSKQVNDTAINSSSLVLCVRNIRLARRNRIPIICDPQGPAEKILHSILKNHTTFPAKNTTAIASSLNFFGPADPILRSKLLTKIITAPIAKKIILLNKYTKAIVTVFAIADTIKILNNLFQDDRLKNEKQILSPSRKKLTSPTHRGRK